MKRSYELAPPTLMEETEFRICFAIGAFVVAVASLFTGRR